MQPTEPMSSDVARIREIVSAALATAIVAETEEESQAAGELADYYAKFLAKEDVKHAQSTAEFIKNQLLEAERLGWVEGWPAMTQSRPPAGGE